MKNDRSRMQQAYLNLFHMIAEFLPRCRDAGDYPVRPAGGLSLSMP